MDNLDDLKRFINENLLRGIDRTQLERERAASPMLATLIDNHAACLDALQWGVTMWGMRADEALRRIAQLEERLGIKPS